MRFYGLFGNPLGHSISPQIHKKIYEFAEIEAAYKTFELESDELTRALGGMKLLGINGVNVTIPYKQDFIPLLDSLSPLAERLHSVNTIKNNAGKMEGYNTDYHGIGLTFSQRNWQVKDKSVYILGSGGASHAAAHFFHDHGATSVTIVSRTPAGQNGKWNYIDYETLATLTGDILVNCTPVGMYPKMDASPVKKEVVASFDIIFDAIYNPAETLFLKWAKELGKDHTNGLDMLVGQAIKSVEIWEDQEISPEKITAILQDFRDNWKGSSL